MSFRGARATRNLNAGRFLKRFLPSVEMTKWMVFQSLMKHWQSVYLFDPEGFFLHAIEESIGYEIREE